MKTCPHCTQHITPHLQALLDYMSAGVTELTVSEFAAECERRHIAFSTLNNIGRFLSSHGWRVVRRTDRDSQGKLTTTYARP